MRSVVIFVYPELQLQIALESVGGQLLIARLRARLHQEG